MAKRIDDRDAVTGRQVVSDHAFEQRGFPGARLSYEMHVPGASVSGERKNLAVVRGDRNIVMCRLALHGAVRACEKTRPCLGAGSHVTSACWCCVHHSH